MVRTGHVLSVPIHKKNLVAKRQGFFLHSKYGWNLFRPREASIKREPLLITFQS